MATAKKINFKVVLSLVLSVAIILSTFIGLNLSTTALASAEYNGLLYFADDFERKTISTEESGWIEQKTGTDTKNTINSGVLILGDTSGNADDGSGQVKGYGYDLVMRPMSEAALDQRASVEINNLHQLFMPNGSANLHLRLLSNRYMLQKDNLVADQSYAVRVGYNKMQIVRVGINEYLDAKGYDLTSGVASVEVENISPDNTYKLEFVAKGSNPTTLTATLYDLTAKKVVATVSGTDNSYALQFPGTAAVSMSGGANIDKRAEVDNFEYEHLAEIPCFYDAFERATITANESGWNDQSSGSNSIDTGTGYVLVKSNTWDTYNQNMLLRPMEEAAINQKASVMITNMGHTGWINTNNSANKATGNVHVRATASGASYVAAIGIQSLNIYRVDSSGAATKIGDGVTLVSNIPNVAAHKFRLELIAEGTYPTKLTANFYDLTTNELLYTYTATDTTAELQRAGTVGVSVQGGSSRIGRFDDFVYENLDTTVNVFDDFERTYITTDGTVNGEGNSTGWVEQAVESGNVTTSSNFIGNTETEQDRDGWLRIAGTGWDEYTENVVLRHMDEAAINQKASVTAFGMGHMGWYSSSTQKSTANVHVRATSTSDKNVVSYFAAFGLNDSSGTTGHLTIYKYDSKGLAKIGSVTTEKIDTTNGNRLELIAEGTYPTTLTANVYDIKTESVKGTVTVTDSTAELQCAGTVGLSIQGGNSRISRFDNFMYEYEPDLPFYDDFESSTTIEQTGWVQQNADAGNAIGEITDLSKAVQSSNVLQIKSTSVAGEYTKNVVLRPMDEAAINQKASVSTYKMGHAGYSSGEVGSVTKAATANIHVRAINTSGSDIVSYFAAFGQGDKDGKSGHLTIYKWDSADNKVIRLKDVTINESISGDVGYRLELTAEGIYPTTLTATVYDPDNKVVKGTVTVNDSTEELQQAGTVGLSIQGNGRTSKFDNFMYETYDEVVEEVIAGDVDRDGICDTTDDRQLRNKLLGLETTFMGNLGCDVNGDGFVDIRDVVTLQKAIAGTTEAYHLSNTYTKLVKEQQLNVAYFGGSITAGYGSTVGNSWRELTTSYLQEKFPSATINETNAAIGGTGSSYGVYRALSDLKLETVKQDLVFIEFGVNDNLDDISKATAKANMEYIIRTIYKYSPDADIIIVLTTASNLWNWYDSTTHWWQAKAHEEIANEYGLPFIKVGPMLWNYMNEISNNNATSVLSEYLPDGVHPSDKGYAKYAEYMTAYLDSVFDSKISADDDTRTSYMPENPLYTDYVSPYMDNFAGEATDAVANATIDENGYLTSSTEGTSFTIKFKGTDLKLWSWSTPKSGSISVSIDGGEATTVDLYRATAGNHKIFTLASALENKEHTVTITLNATDKGSNLDIRQFMISGDTDQSGITLVK